MYRDYDDYTLKILLFKMVYIILQLENVVRLA